MTECWITLIGDGTITHHLQKVSMFPHKAVKHAVFGTASQERDHSRFLSPDHLCSFTEYTDWGTKLKYHFVLHWIISSSFAPLPLRMNPLSNRASILSSDAVVNWDSVSSLSQATAVPRCISWFIMFDSFQRDKLVLVGFFLWISVSDKLLRSNVKVPASSSG